MFDLRGAHALSSKDTSYYTLAVEAASALDADVLLRYRHVASRETLKSAACTIYMARDAIGLLEKLLTWKPGSSLSSVNMLQRAFEMIFRIKGLDSYLATTSDLE